MQTTVIGSECCFFVVQDVQIEHRAFQVSLICSDKYFMLHQLQRMTIQT